MALLSLDDIGMEAAQCGKCGREFSVSTVGRKEENCPECQPDTTQRFYDSIMSGMLGWTDYESLAFLCAVLRAVQKIEHAAHWRASYESHLLFQRLYEGISDEIDDVGEKCIGFGAEVVCDTLDMTAIEQLVITRGQGIITDLSSCIFFEEMLVEVIDIVFDTLKESGLFTEGIGNMLAGMRDNHEKSLYLLKRRAENH
jgi:DNA-binding ferritin-like protein